jgi:proline iminopeptidase
MRLPALATPVNEFQSTRRRMLLGAGAAAALATVAARSRERIHANAGEYRHSFRSRMVDLPDTRLEILEAGEGKTTFVCVHPYWDNSGPNPGGGLTETLARAGRTIHICPRATAGSAPESRPEKLTMSQLADDMEAVAKTLSIESWVPVGTSTGGMTAMISGTRYPHRAAGMILVCTAPSYHFLDGPGSIYSPNNPIYRKLADLRAATNSGPAYARALAYASLYNDAVVEQVMRHSRISAPRLSSVSDEVIVGKWDIGAELRSVSAPVLIIAGRFDAPVGSIQEGFKILEAIEGSEYAIMNGSGHFPYEEEAGHFADVVAEFTARRL